MKGVIERIFERYGLVPVLAYFLVVGWLIVGLIHLYFW
jgi:hypothetical protein